MAWTQYGRACEMRDEIKKGMWELVMHPEVYDDTCIEAKEARNQWKLIEACVRGLRKGQRHYGEDEELGSYYYFDGSRERWREGWCEETKIEVLVAMRFFQWYFREQGRGPW